MTRLIEIINNTLVVKKQILEQELEEIINTKENKVQGRVDEGIRILEEITKIAETTKTLETYINNNNK
jgi:hypothetical protein|tara:strand:+ start:621 stop:824 length:204 start_codon:yes stop_codon:yes gene_type:complete